jgi:hypothetical protein
MKETHTMNELLSWMEAQDLDVALPIAGVAVLLVLILLSTIGTKRASGRRNRSGHHGDGAHAGVAAGSSKGSGKDKDGDGDGDGDGGGDGGGD